MVRKANKSLKSWVKFVKQVQKEEGGSYKEAMMSAKSRKDKGANWMIGGTGGVSSTVISGAKDAAPPTGQSVSSGSGLQQAGSANVLSQGAAALGSALSGVGPSVPQAPPKMNGGKKHKKTAKKQNGRRRKTSKK